MARDTRGGALMRGPLQRMMMHGLGAIALCCSVSAASASDVPYVPTPMNVVDAMLALGKVGPGDYLIDLGSGDGRISIRAATRYGTRGFGVDLEANLVRDATREARRQGVDAKVKFEARNIFDTDISRATVVTAYLLSSVNMRLRPELFAQLKPGTRIVTHDFGFGEWAPDQKLTIDVPDKAYGPPNSDIMLWIIPVNLAGVWQWSLPSASGVARYEARIEQKFQVLVGTAGTDAGNSRIIEGRVTGTAVAWTLGSGAQQMRYSGVLAGDTIKGQVNTGGGVSQPWQARRVRAGRINISGDADFRVAAVAFTKEQ
ncbi:MAG: SAM-dependent methyltransferase [Burkholderiales bacterium]